MSNSPLFEEGLKVRKEVLGEDYVNKSMPAPMIHAHDGGVVDRVLLGRLMDAAGAGSPHPLDRQSGDAGRASTGPMS